MGIIPARYASTRFPAKALADIAGKPMVQRVYERCIQAELLSRVIVATDHQQIANTVFAFGGTAVLTNEHHPSGTDRCHEAFSLLGEEYDYIINIQGDEPFIHPKQIDTLARLLADKKPDIGTLVRVFSDEETLFSPNTVKVLLGTTGQAMAFSRQVIPYLRNVDKAFWLQSHTYFQHVGIYGYSAEALEAITLLPQSTLEKAESLEQLRWLENGFRIAAAVTEHESHGVDTPEDLERVVKLFEAHL